MNSILKFGIPALLIISHLTSCQKKPEVIPPKEEPSCRITIFKANGFDRTIGYNAYGNPIHPFNPPRQGQTGLPSVYFIYDKFNRLSEFISYYQLYLDSNSRILQVNYDVYVKYVYADDNPSSMPIRDTFKLGQRIPVLPSVGLYEYDRLGRISKRTVLSETPDDKTQVYEYDANGNLITPNVTYDSKKNYRGRNKVLMLIDRNYSVNNLSTASSYNTEGYPLSFPRGNGSPDRFLFQGISGSEMQYDCSSSAKTN